MGWRVGHRKAIPRGGTATVVKLANMDKSKNNKQKKKTITRYEEFMIFFFF